MNIPKATTHSCYHSAAHRTGFVPERTSVPTRTLASLSMLVLLAAFVFAQPVLVLIAAMVAVGAGIMAGLDQAAARSETGAAVRG